MRGWLLLQENRLEEAQRDYESIIKIGTDGNVSVNILSCANRGMACVCSEKGNFSQAKAFLATAQVTDVDKYPTLICQGLVYSKYNKVFEIEQISADLESVNNNIPHGIFLRAQARYRWGLRKVAIEDLETCIKLCISMEVVPGHLLTLARQEIIRILIKDEKYTRAHEYATMLRNNLTKYCLYETTDDFVEYGMRTGLWDIPTLKDVSHFEHWTKACCIICQLSEAEELLETKSTAGSDVPSLDFRESLSNVIKELLLAQKAKPGTPEIWHWLGYTHGQMQNWDEAYFCYRKCLEKEDVLDRDVVRQISYGMEVARACLATKEGRSRQAIEYFIAAEKFQSTFQTSGARQCVLLSDVPLWRKALVQLSCARNLASRGDRAKLLKVAVKDLQGAVERLHSHPKLMQARGYLAVAYRLLGKPEAALVHLDTALYMMQETVNVTRNQDNGISIWKEQLLPLAQTLWTERACCFLMMGALEQANENLEVCHGASNDRGDNSIHRVLQARLKLAVGQTAEALHCSTEALWEARSAMRDPYLRAWVNVQHTVCLLSNGMFEKAETHCTRALNDANAIANKYPETLLAIDLRAIMKIVNGKPHEALSDWQDLTRRQPRFLMAANDATVLRQIMDVLEKNQGNLNVKRYLQLAQKLSVAIRLASKKRTPRRNNLVGVRAWHLFDLFYLHLYRGIYLFYSESFQKAAHDFEISLSYLLAGEIRANRLTVAMMSLFLYFNGALSFLNAKMFAQSFAWFELALHAIDSAIGLADGENLSNAEAKLLCQRKKVITLFYGMTGLASGDTRRGRGALKSIGGKKILSRLQVGQSKSHGSIARVDVLDGRINSLRKNNTWKTLASGQRKMSFWKTHYCSVQIGAITLSTRSIGFWPVLPQSIDLAPSLQRFCIVSLGIENVDDCNDTIACPSLRINNANFQAAVEYENSLFEDGQLDGYSSAGSEGGNPFTEALPKEPRKSEETILPLPSFGAYRNAISPMPDTAKGTTVGTEEAQGVEDEISEGPFPQSFQSIENENPSTEQVMEELLPTWESLGFNGNFEDHFDVFAGGVPSDSTSSGSSYLSSTASLTE